MIPIRYLLLLLASTVSLKAESELALDRIFSDHMVLQRDVALPIHGTAKPGSRVTVRFAGQTEQAVANAQGRWRATLAALKANNKPAVMSITGTREIQIQDVLVGDVWVCSGQSNMEWPLGRCNRPDDIKAADLPLLRQFMVAKEKDTQPREAVKGSWSVCTPTTAGNFTGVGFYFARAVQQETGIPLGLINTTLGGTPIEPWVAPNAMNGIPKTFRAGMKSSHPWHSLYNAMVHPLTRFPIKGFLWYQGESNAMGDPLTDVEDSYLAKMQALITGWRAAWGQGDLPFYYVQLSTYQPQVKDPSGGPTGSVNWGRVCMAQRKALAIPNTGMAVAIDIPDPDNTADVHPKNKKDVGERLARWALARDYGKKGIAVSGPLYQSMQVKGSAIHIRFENPGDGLMVAKKDKGYDPVVPTPEDPLQGFAIAGSDKVWVWAEARIIGNEVVVASPKVSKPVAVRYAFSSNPTGCNLYGKNGLPASPFRTDDW